MNWGDVAGGALCIAVGIIYGRHLAARAQPAPTVDDGTIFRIRDMGKDRVVFEFPRGPEDPIMTDPEKRGRMVAVLQAAARLMDKETLP